MAPKSISTVHIMKGYLTSEKTGCRLLALSSSPERAFFADGGKKASSVRFFEDMLFGIDY